jgi:hypothetical protein
LRKSGGQEIIKSVSERKGAGFLSDGDDEEWLLKITHSTKIQ